MATSHKVMGQTGRVVLSDEAIQYKLSQKRTVRYQYTKMKSGFMCWVCGPFHSKLYGACGFGTKKASAKKALRRNLGNNHNYIGVMLFSDVDTSDTVARPDLRLLEENASARPITVNELTGSAGQ